MDLRGGISPSGFVTKIFPPMSATCLAHIILYFITLITGELSVSLSHYYNSNIEWRTL
jgi:hypothetical protein